MDARVWNLSPAEYAHYLGRLSRYHDRRRAMLSRRIELLRYRGRVLTRASLVFAVLFVLTLAFDWVTYGVFGVAAQVVISRAG